LDAKRNGKKSVGVKCLEVCLPKQVIESLRGWMKDGWTATKTNGGHWRLTHPEVDKPIFCPSTPSDWRSMLNTQALIRRSRRSDDIQDSTEQKTKIIKSKPKPNNTQVIFDLYGIDIPGRRFKRMPRKGQWVTDSDLVFDDDDNAADEPDNTEAVLAWSLAYMRLRAEGHGIDVVRVLRNRFRTDEEFRATILKKFQDSSPEEYAALRAERRHGSKAVSVPPPLFVVPKPSSENYSKQVDFDQQIIALQAKLTEAKQALEAERARILSLTQKMESTEASLRQELIDMRTRKNQAEAMRNDMEEQLQEERAKRMETADEALGPHLRMLSELFQQHIAKMDERFGDIERRFNTFGRHLSDIEEKLSAFVPATGQTTPRQKPEVEGLKKRPRNGGVVQKDGFETIGEHIKFLRNKLGLSQTALGSMVGTSGSTISFWESGKSQVGQQYMKKLCKALKVTEAVLVNDL